MPFGSPADIVGFEGLTERCCEGVILFSYSEWLDVECCSGNSKPIQVRAIFLSGFSHEGVTVKGARGPRKLEGVNELE